MKNKYLDDSKDWKERYLQTLEELESKEKNWLAADDVLRQLVTRLILAADTSHDKLNKQLEILRNALREGVSPLKLKKALEEISVSITELEEKRKSNRELESGKQLLTHLIKNLSDIEKLNKSLLKISKSLRNSNDIRDLVKVVEQLSALIEKETARAGGEGRKFFSLFSEKQSAEESIEEQQEQTASAGDMSLEEAKQALNQLLSRMLLPTDLQLEANLIRHLTERAERYEDLHDTLEKTVELVATLFARVRDERESIESFLRQLSGRLAEFDIDLKKSLQFHNETLEHNAEINGVISSEMLALDDEIEAIKDFEILKSAIQSRMVVIRNKLDSVLEKSSVAQGSSYLLVEQLNSKVKNLESETQALREQLEKQKKETFTDALTSLPNRYAYDERIRLEIARFKRNLTPFCLMVWDVDFFKKINDSYGHAAGDRVLKVISELLRKSLREVDYVGRYGGEEFVGILPDTSNAQALVVAEKLRKNIESCEFHFREKRVVVTASCGVAQISSVDTDKTLFERADSALYKAKAAGRNRIESA